MSDDTRQRLLEAAGELFAAQGFEATGVREICEKARANLSAVNYHFGDKQRLYDEAVRMAQCARLDEVPLPQWGPDVPAEVRLRDFVRTLLTRMMSSPKPVWHRDLMLREIAHPTRAGAMLVEESIRPTARQLHAILDDLLPPDTPAERRHLIAFSIVGQCFFHYVNRPIITLLIGEEAADNLTIDRLADHVTDFSLAALGIPPAGGVPPAGPRDSGEDSP